jgi:serine/threonine protein kinase
MRWSGELIDYGIPRSDDQRYDKIIIMDFSQQVLRNLASRWLDPADLPKNFRICTDTTDFFRVDYNDVLILDDHPYLVRCNEKEGRFGIDDEPKFWVKRSTDLLDGSKKIIKLVFNERFQARVGPITFDCVRSPAKEARVLSLVKGHPNFMQGFSVSDDSCNVVRIIDYIYGKNLPAFISGLKKDHEEYFNRYFPSIMCNYVETVKAIKFLHENGEIHGDVRRDHIIIDKTTNKFRWIDFDFIFYHHENRFGYDIFGLGNILVYLVGGGDVIVQHLRDERPDAFQRLTSDDTNIIFSNRVVNLKKVFPYIPDDLNFVLRHFSKGAEIFYDDTVQFLDDLLEAGCGLQEA